MINRRVKSSTLFPNGMIVTFGTDGEQIGELQGAYAIDLHKRILLESIDGAMIRGFDILPHGFNVHAKDWVDLWIEKDMGWDEINEI